MYAEIEQFKQENPKVVEAMRLFGITIEKYREALDALQPKYTLYTASSTKVIKRPVYMSGSTMFKEEE